MSLLLGQVLSSTVRLKKYPKSAVDVFVMVIEDDGGASHTLCSHVVRDLCMAPCMPGSLGAAITAASVAFADAGIELYDLAAACTVVREGEAAVALCGMH